MFRVRFWGVRGSIPSPGPQTAGIGGNTSCVEVRCGEQILIFDGGTGLRLLGRELAKSSPLTVHLFFSHVHWDHIQGFPFFGPAFGKGNTIHMYGSANYFGTVETAMAGQMEFPNFPVKLNELGSQQIFHDIQEDQIIDVAPGIRVLTAAGHHPGGVLAYRVEHGGKSLVYATDTEHLPNGLDERLVKLAQGTDLLIYDSMYTPEEYEGKADGQPRMGWGHSTFVAGARLAEAAAVKQYILFHHDPDQDDDEVRDKERRAREIFPSSLAAYEGLVIDLL